MALTETEFKDRWSKLHGGADVEGVVGLEAPRVEADGDVVGEHIVAGEVEIDHAREFIFQKKQQRIKTSQ